MSCFGCSKKYGLFCKEHGCPSCGYSYCGKCLSRKAAVPRHGGKILNVCLICKDKLSKLEASEKVIDYEALPGTLVTKVGKGGASNKNDVESRTNAAALLEDDPPADLAEALMPITTQKAHSNTESADIVENLDDEIYKRLKNLKSGSGADDTSTTDADIRSRLANLTGIPQKDYSKKDLLLSTDQRTDEEKMKDLLEQFMGETQLDQRVEGERMDAISDIERRLRALRDTSVDSGNGVKAASPDTNTPSDNEQDDETVLKAIIEKYLAEARLPEPPSDLETELLSNIPRPPTGSSQPVDLEELPFCNICNEDGVYRCKGCDGEIFCAQCFREVHDDDEEYRVHVRVPYQPPPQFKEDHF